MVTQNYAAGTAVIGDLLVSQILAACADWTLVSSLGQLLTEISKPELQKVIESMIEQRLLLREGDAIDPAETAMDTWADWNPSAGFFHFTTKHAGGPVSLDAEEQVLREERLAHGSPEAIKRYPRAKVIQLTDNVREGEFPGVLRDRRTWRSFSERPLMLSDISTLAGLAWGVQRTAETLGLGLAHLKTSPSPGARQTLEGYVLAVNVDGLAPGLYHYVSDRHCLELIKPGATAKTIERYIPGQWWYESAGALFLMTAVFERIQWRYRSPFAYRSVLLEAGHVCQTLLLVATWLGLAPFCTGLFADAVVEKDLRIDGVRESFIYGAGVGTRPPGVEWAPWPLHATARAPFSKPRTRKRPARSTQ
ncbi:MAG: SagB/ThcOx family dehydrogenase [Vicinamibacterales bacterium]